MNSNQFNNNINNKIISLLFLAFILLSIISNSESAIKTNSPILLNERKALNIICNYTNPQNQVILVKWNWKKDGLAYEDLPTETKDRIKIDPKDSSIVITRADKDDIGYWECTDPQNPDNRETVKVLSRPWLEPFHEYQKTNYKSANVVEGQRFYLRCKIIEGYDREASIAWFKFDESEENNENKVLTSLADEGPTGRLRIEIINQTEQTLTIEKIQPSDRFFYTCMSKNEVFTFNNTILLRVKDKLGALWPFLGIVAEVVILCTIIFIYEKRRIKPDFDDTDNNDTEPKGTQDRSKPQDVRQRK